MGNVATIVARWRGVGCAGAFLFGWCDIEIAYSFTISISSFLETDLDSNVRSQCIT